MKYLQDLQDILDFVLRIESLDEAKVWARILDKLSTTLGFEAATYYSYLASKGHLLPVYAIGPNAADLKGTPVDIRTGLCGWVATHRQPLLIEDPYKDPRFLREVDHVTGFKTRNCLCLPLLDRQDLTGVIQLLNKGAAITPDDLVFVETACHITHLALHAKKEEKS